MSALQAGAPGAQQVGAPGAQRRTAIVIPVHNALEYVERTLNRLDMYNTYQPLVIVDDRSDNDTKAWLDMYQRTSGPTRKELAILTNDRQQLFTRTVNRGLRYAWTRWRPQGIVVLNSDVELFGGWLNALTSAGESRQRVGIVGYPDSPDGQPPLVKKIKMPEYVTGHCLWLNTAMLAEIGVFCETDLTGRDSPELAGLKGQAHIGSDRVLSWRANMAGWQTLTVNDGCIQHAAGKSWNHDLNWLAHFELEPLWEATDSLNMPDGWLESGLTEEKN